MGVFISNYSKPFLKEQVVSSAYKALGSVNHSIAQGADITEQSLVNTANFLALKTRPSDEQLNMLTYAALESISQQYGHFYDFFYINETHFAFLIADVSGKGIPAALFMMNAKLLLKSNLLSGFPLNEAINKTNALFSIFLFGRALLCI